MYIKDIDNKAEALLELDTVFDFFSLIRKDNILVILSDSGEDGEFTVRVLDSTQNEEASTVKIITQGFFSMLEDDPDTLYMRGTKVEEQKYVNYGENIVPFHIRNKRKEKE